MDTRKSPTCVVRHHTSETEARFIQPSPKKCAINTTATRVLTETSVSSSGRGTMEFFVLRRHTLLIFHRQFLFNREMKWRYHFWKR
ncbi:hypothetical protein TNCT_54291 [Trichonephila clavata]|uniref:Uncharacterized protein n=1 Tax=Trichonephila clavata TaxID=2740835 RepID=A0A8X6K0K8_TRICU|nr:hypothetical protein TNCT_54291 [Trichonephila clavata]